MELIGYIKQEFFFFLHVVNFTSLNNVYQQCFKRQIKENAKSYLQKRLHMFNSHPLGHLDFAEQIGTNLWFMILGYIKKYINTNKYNLTVLYRLLNCCL